MEKYEIKTPQTIVIGDQMYIEENMMDLVYKRKFDFSTTMKSSISFEQDENGDWEITICIAPTKELLKQYECGSYPSAFDCEYKELGCDTASFDISTDSRYISIYTMADGYYGDVHDLSRQGFSMGAIIRLGLGDYAWDEQTKDKLLYVFGGGDKV